MASLDTVRSYLADEHSLAVVSTVQAVGAVLSTVVNCRVIDHPITREARIALVSMGGAARLSHVRRPTDRTPDLSPAHHNTEEPHE